MTTTATVGSGLPARAARVRASLRLALRIFLRIDGTQRAGAFGHFAFFSLFPTIILLVASASIFVDRDRATSVIIEFVDDYVAMSTDNQNFVLQTIQGVVDSRGHASVVALILLCWAAMRFLATLIRATNRAWGSEVNAWWRLPMKSLLLLMVMVALIPPGIAVSTWVEQFEPPGIEGNAALSAAWAVVNALVPLALLFGGLALFYKFAPRRATKFKEVWLPALFTTVLLAVAEFLFRFYLERFATLNAVYGALGGIMALLMWIYLSGVIFIFGACLCAACEAGNQRNGGIDLMSR